MGHMMLGSVASAVRLLESARAIDDAEPGTHANLLASVDPAIFLRSYLARTLAMAGLLDQADARALECMAIARQRGHVPSILMAWGPLIRSHLDGGRYAEAIEEATNLLEVADKYGVKSRMGLARFYLGLAETAVGKGDSAARSLRTGFDLWRESSGIMHRSDFCASAADALLRLRHVEAARALIDEGWAVREQSDERFADSQLYRLTGWLAELNAADDSARAAYVRAHDSARLHGALLWELRAARALADLQARQGQRAEAQATLDPVYARFSEGFDYPELIAARQQLDALRA
jgi:tetratricopeptide (TPR) repeat protein